MFGTGSWGAGLGHYLAAQARWANSQKVNSPEFRAQVEAANLEGPIALSEWYKRAMIDRLYSGAECACSRCCCRRD